MTTRTGVDAPSGVGAMARAVAQLRSRFDERRSVEGLIPFLSDGYVRTSVDGTIVQASDLAASVLGAVDGADVRGRVLRDLVAPWEQGRFAALVTASRHQVATTNELTIDVAPRPTIRVQAAAVTGSTGETHWLLRRLASPTEARDLHPAELGVRADAIDHMPAVAYVTLTDPAFTPQFLGPTLEDLVGATQEEWLGNAHGWLRAIHPDDRLRVHEARLRASETGLMDCSYRLRRPDGEVVWVADRASRSTNGDEQRWYGVLVDVTHTRNLAELAGSLYDEVHERANRAETVGQAKHTALEIFAHDLRSPLAAAVTLVEHLGTDEGEPGAVDDLHESLARSLSTVTGLLDEVRELQALGATGTTSPWQVTDVGALAAELAAERDDARLSVDAASITVEAIPNLLRRAIGNLVDNALRHAGLDGRVVLRVAADGPTVVVEDDGPGIPAELREHLFDPFVRGAGPAGGLGLGLALVQRIAEMHGGQVRAENVSSIGGARFELSLPPAGVTPEGDEASFGVTTPGVIILD